jgi:hypothetical protein
MDSADVLIVREEGELDSSIEEPTKNNTTSSSIEMTETTQEPNTRPRPRNRVPHVERRDQQAFKKPHPVSGSTNTYPYVHSSTMTAIEKDLAEARDAGICGRCDKILPVNKESARRHIWDHYVIYACECGHYTTKCESLYSHQKKKHVGYKRHTRVDKCFFHQARLEINAMFPAEFPDKLEVPYVFPTPKPRHTVTKSPKVKPPTPKKTKPAATITAPLPTRSPVKQSTPSHSPRKVITPSQSPTADKSVEGPDIEAILSQMTSFSSKPVSPVKEPQVKVSALTKGQKRTVTFSNSTPPPKKVRTSKVPTIVKDLRYELDQLKRDYRCIDNIQQLLCDTKTTADNRLSRIEEMLSHLERESVEN